MAFCRKLHALFNPRCKGLEKKEEKNIYFWKDRRQVDCNQWVMEGGQGWSQPQKFIPKMPKSPGLKR
jgi:hypothetical protein